MKKILFILFMIQTVSCSAQKLQLPLKKTVSVSKPEQGVERRNHILINETTPSALKEIKWFIDKQDSIDDFYGSTSNQFIVYVISVYKNDSNQKGYCFTLGYIMNSYEYNTVQKDFYFNIGEEIILVGLSEEVNKEDLLHFDLQELDKTSRIKIAQKLYPQAIGGFTYQASGMIYCKDGEKIESTYYENADQIPFNKSIHTTFPEGNIELLKEGKK
ncbi:MAG: hypothetical protein IT232_10615 [Flavobacteriales bacterium]|nr:hypothetical protein [Flavobacteriales bacterium]